jgi:hypothetical protein
MTVTQIIAAVLLLIGFHLLLYGFLRRRIAAAKREKGIDH